MKQKVFIMGEFPPELKEYIARYCEAEYVEGGLNKELLFEKIKDASGMLIRPTIRVDEALLDAAPNLKVVSMRSVGYDCLNIPAMKARGIVGTHTPGVLDNSVADMALALMLAAGRRVTYCDRFIRQGKWAKGVPHSDLFSMDVYGKTLGIIGMGRIGQKVAKRAHLGFGMNILYYGRSTKPEAEQLYGAQKVELDELCTRADYIVVLISASKETMKLVGEPQFALMKPTAVFVNVARGAVVDEAALIKALKEGQIYAAGLDVFEKEPLPPDSELMKLENVVLQPHNASGTSETMEAVMKLAAENLVCALTGQPVPAIIPEFQ